MKRIHKIIAVFAILLGFSIPAVAAAVYCPNAVRVAIKKYKAQDYVGCIQDLEDYSSSDPSNAIAYYYTGIAYMKIGLKDKAIESFQKVSMINTVPVLSSYAIQATNCMNNNVSPCTYKKYNKTEISEMVVDPAAFFAKKAEEEANKANQPEEVPVEDTTDIDKLIHGQYPGNIHPDANKTIQETRLIQEQERVNAELNQQNRGTRPKKAPAKSDAGSLKTEKIALADVSDKEIADAVRTLNKAGYKFVAPKEQQNSSASDSKVQTASTNDPNKDLYKQMATRFSLNDDAAEMALMFGNNNNNSKNDSFNAMIPLLLMQEQQRNSDGNNTQQRKIDPELVKTMMMSQMMGDFDLGFEKEKD